MDNPGVAIIILNWNGWQDTIECLESLYQITYTNFNIILVDNNSQDNSLEKIRSYALGKIKVESNFLEYRSSYKPIKIDELTRKESLYSNKNNSIFEDRSLDEKLIIIKNEKNFGFAEGNNIGIRYALKALNPDYILLLNNDIIVKEDFLDDLVIAGEKNEKVGILGPKIYYYYHPDVIWSAGCKISWKLSRGIHIGIGELDQGQYDEKKEVEYVSGSAFLIKTEVIKKIGLMDKNYYLYFEESDWTLRANQAGFKSLFVPNAKIWHKVSRSGGGMSKPIGLYYITRNRWIFMKKWAKKSDYFIFKIYQALGIAIFPLILTIYYRNFQLLRAYFNGLRHGIFSKTLQINHDALFPAELVE